MLEIRCWVVQNIILEYFRCLGYNVITDLFFCLADQMLSSLIVVTQTLRFLGTKS